MNAFLTIYNHMSIEEYIWMFCKISNRVDSVMELHSIIHVQAHNFSCILTLNTCSTTWFFLHFQTSGFYVSMFLVEVFNLWFLCCNLCCILRKFFCIFTHAIFVLQLARSEWWGLCVTIFLFFLLHSYTCFRVVIFLLHSHICNIWIK